MTEADLSKIVNLIMENPHIIDEIKKLTEKSDADEAQKGAQESAESDAAAESEKVFAPSEVNIKRARRHELLAALKPYVSSERGRAIESMMTIADVLDAMKGR